jgi:hypothetical protein
MVLHPPGSTYRRSECVSHIGSFGCLQQLTMLSLARVHCLFSGWPSYCGPNRYEEQISDEHMIECFHLRQSMLAFRSRQRRKLPPLMDPIEVLYESVVRHPRSPAPAVGLLDPVPTPALFGCVVRYCPTVGSGPMPRWQQSSAPLAAVLCPVGSGPMQRSHAPPTPLIPLFLCWRVCVCWLACGLFVGLSLESRCCVLAGGMVCVWSCR